MLRILVKNLLALFGSCSGFVAIGAQKMTAVKGFTPLGAVLSLVSSRTPGASPHGRFI